MDRVSLRSTYTHESLSDNLVEVRSITVYWSLGYDEALDLAQLPPLSTRRDCASLCYMYNMVHNNMDFESALVGPRPVSRFTRHSNNYQLQQPSCHTNVFQNSFFPKTISMWNSLPKEVLACPSLANFKEPSHSH